MKIVFWVPKQKLNFLNLQNSIGFSSNYFSKNVNIVKYYNNNQLVLIWLSFRVTEVLSSIHVSSKHKAISNSSQGLCYFIHILILVDINRLFFNCYSIVIVMDKWLDSDDLLPYDNQVGGHKFTKEKPLLGLYNVTK